MIASFLRPLFAAVLLLAAGASIAETRHTEELMRKSGIWKQVADFPALVQAGAEETRKKRKASGKSAMTDAEYARFVAMLGRAFAPERMRRIIARELERNLSAEDEAKMLAFLSSDLGKRATKLEESASDPAMAKEIESEAEAYFLKVPGARVAKLMAARSAPSKWVTVRPR